MLGMFETTRCCFSRYLISLSLPLSLCFFPCLPGIVSPLQYMKKTEHKEKKKKKKKVHALFPALRLMLSLLDTGKTGAVDMMESRLK